MTQQLRLLSLSILLFLLSCHRKGEDSIYLIPKDYEGNLIIIFNHQSGLEKDFKNNSRLYRFDKSGILKTKFGPNYGVQHDEYYYVDSLGNQINLKYIFPSQLRATDEFVIINKETGNDFDTTQKVERHFELLTVGKQLNVDSIGNLRSAFMWKTLK